DALVAGTSASALVSGGVTGPDDLAVAGFTDHDAALLLGRAGHPLRRRERGQLLALVRIADRAWQLLGGDNVPSARDRPCPAGPTGGRATRPRPRLRRRPRLPAPLPPAPPPAVVVPPLPRRRRPRRLAVRRGLGGGRRRPRRRDGRVAAGRRVPADALAGRPPARGVVAGAAHAAHLPGRAPLPDRDREAPPEGAALAPGRDRRRARAPGRRSGRQAARRRPRPARRDTRARLPGDVDGRQRRLVPAPRLRTAGGGTTRGRGPTDLDHVARAEGRLTRHP